MNEQVEATAQVINENIREMILNGDITISPESNLSQYLVIEIIRAIKYYQKQIAENNSDEILEDEKFWQLVLEELEQFYP